VRILGPPSADRNHIHGRAATLGATDLFLTHMLPALWDAALALHVDPVGAIAQSAKETGYGTYRGKVKPDACNPCGLKIRTLGIYGPPTTGDEPLAHAIFPNWQTGALAHTQHLRAYAGWPAEGLIVDPRYHLALKSPRDWCENFEDLSGRWAPSPTYGTELVAIARRLQGTA
jgi:Mannosyl-glycoprotein endo-beta-N-acetylglucosaminidase